ncbi:MAG: ABC transporter permease [Brevinematales bacterium]|nr:ABC transporter permease [Brevinematales bacterium]
MREGNILFLLGFRNLFRHRRRTFLTMVTIAVGVMVFLWADGIYRGMHRQMAENLVRYADGTIFFTTQEYADHEQAFPLRYFFFKPEELRDRLSSFPWVEGVTFRVPFVGEILYGEKSFHAMGYVIDHQRDKEVFDLSRAVVKGKYLEGEVNEVLLGKDLARGLGVDVGDEVMVIVQTKHGTLNALGLLVKGIYRTSHPTLDESCFYVSYETASPLLALEKSDALSAHLRVRWPKGESVESYTRRAMKYSREIASQFTGYRILSFAEKYREIFGLMKTDEGFMYIMLGVIFLISAVGIINTILMSIHERMKEIGVMRALGFSPFEIRLMLTLEGSFVGGIGALVGMVGGILLNAYQVYIGYDMESLGFGGVSGSDFGLPVWGVIYGDWNPLAFLVVFIFAVGMATLSAFLPSRHATRLSVTECLRFV